MLVLKLVTSAMRPHPGLPFPVFYVLSNFVKNLLFSADILVPKLVTKCFAKCSCQKETFLSSCKLIANTIPSKSSHYMISVCLDPPPPPRPAIPCMKLAARLMGMGKMMVELCSAAMLFRVCRYRNCNENKGIP